MVLEDVARLAIDGDRAALEDLVRALQGDVYGIALRMLCNREDAEDATQEILVRIVTRLSQFNFRSKLKTWAFRVGVNYILDVKKSPVERRHLSFEQFAEDLAASVSMEAPEEAERSLLIEEVKIGCTFGMLQCLDRPHRLAYILGEILDLPGPEAAEALDISPDLFRKRLQHARTAILTFTRCYCGLASDTAACSCNRQLPAALRSGKVRLDSYDFAVTASSFQQTRAIIRQVDKARWALEVHRSTQPRASSVDFARRLIESIDTPRDLNSRSSTSRFLPSTSRILPSTCKFRSHRNIANRQKRVSG
jgi:RNA polymerase sigma factor (sigma-70 family)